MKAEIVPLPVLDADGKPTGEMHGHDEGVRPGVTAEAMAKIKTVHKQGIVTPGTSSQICDGAAAVLVCNEAGLKKLGVQPMAKIAAMSVVGSDPVIMLEGPVPATGAALQKAGLKPEDLDVIEVNEAFAPVPIAVAKTFLDGSLDKVN